MPAIDFSHAPAISFDSLPSSLPPLHNIIEPSASSSKKQSKSKQLGRKKSSAKVSAKEAKTQHETESEVDDSSDEDVAQTPGPGHNQRARSVAASKMNREAEIDGYAALEPGSAEAVKFVQTIVHNGHLGSGEFTPAQELEALVSLCKKLWTGLVGKSYFTTHICTAVLTVPFMDSTFPV